MEEKKKEYRPRLNIAENNLILKSRGEFTELNESSSKRYIVLGCAHVPFHNKKITDGIFKLMSDITFDGIVFAGDFLDMAALSSYDRGKLCRTGITLEEEYSGGNAFLDTVDSLLLKGSEKTFMFGNHEDRYWKWKADVDNSKYGDILNPIKALKLDQRGYKVYDNYKEDVHELGSLNVIHGEYYNIHCAKKHLDVFRRNILFYHTHRIQMHREGDFASYNGGFLGDIESNAFSYANRGMKSAWGNGFTIVTLSEDSHFVEIVNCINNKFAYNGKIY